MTILAFFLAISLLYLLLLGTAPNWAVGYNITCQFKIGAGAYTAINILDWDWAEEIADQETFHSGSGGVDEAIAGKLMGRGAVHANIDLANLFNAATPGIVAGQKGLLQLGISASKTYTIPIMILTVGPKGAVNGKVEFSFGYRLSGDAGTYVRPS